MLEIARELLRVDGSPQQMLAALTLIIAGGAVALSFVLHLLGGHRQGITVLLAAAAGFVLSPFRSPVLLLAAIPFAVGFIGGRSTRVPRDFADFLDTVLVSPVEYHQYMQHLLEMKRSGDLDELFVRGRLDPSARMHLMMQLHFASLYRSAPMMAAGLSITFVWLWALAQSGQVEGIAALVFVVSFPYGSTMGLLVTYILGHALEPPPGAVVMTPTFTSFVKGIQAIVLPTAAMVTATLALPFVQVHSPWTRWALVPIVAMTGLSVLHTVFEHRRKLILFEQGISICRHRPVAGCTWRRLRGVTIRERRTWFFRTERLLEFRRDDGERFSYRSSMLAPFDERRLLIAVRRRAPETETVLHKRFF